MEMEVMMAMWFAEMERLYNKVGERTLTEQFFVELTLEFDDALNAGALARQQSDDAVPLSAGCGRSLHQAEPAL